MGYSFVNDFTSWVGNAWNNITGKNQQQKKQLEFSAAEAQKQRDWEEQMSNTAYQRGTADMEKAGLNPAMMYSGGSGGGGAYTPHGAAATGSAVGGSDPISGISSLINSAANLARSFNSDNNRRNDVNIKQINSAVKDLKPKPSDKYTKEQLNSLYSDLDNVKI